MNRSLRQCSPTFKTYTKTCSLLFWISLVACNIASAEVRLPRFFFRQYDSATESDECDLGLG